MPTSQENINDIPNKEYSIVRLDKTKLPDLAALHAAVYNTRADVEYFTKKYDTEYTGVEFAGFMAYNQENIAVAYYGVIPCFIVYGNESVLAAQSADTMTHSQHRYKGMFVELSHMTFDLCRQLNILLIFGFPNQNSYPGAVNKLGWKMTESMTYFLIKVKSLPLEALSCKWNIFKGIYKRYSRFILTKKSLALQGIANSIIQSGFAGVYRTEEYLKYKTFSPTRVVAIGESKIWISAKSGLLIGDMEAVNKANFKSVIVELKKIAKKLGVKQIQFHTSSGTELYELFAADYQAMPSYPVLFQDFGSPVPMEKIKFTFADIDIF